MRKQETKRRSMVLALGAAVVPGALYAQDAPREVTLPGVVVVGERVPEAAPA